MNGIFGATGDVPTDPGQYTWKDSAGTAHPCPYLGRAAMWDTAWPCNQANEGKASQALMAWLSANPGKAAADWMAGQRSGSFLPPKGFPPIVVSAIVGSNVNFVNGVLYRGRLNVPVGTTVAQISNALTAGGWMYPAVYTAASDLPFDWPWDQQAAVVQSGMTTVYVEGKYSQPNRQVPLAAFAPARVIALWTRPLPTTSAAPAAAIAPSSSPASVAPTMTIAPPAASTSPTPPSDTTDAGPYRTSGAATVVSADQAPPPAAAPTAAPVALTVPSASDLTSKWQQLPTGTKIGVGVVGVGLGLWILKAILSPSPSGA